MSSVPPKNILFYHTGKPYDVFSNVTDIPVSMHLNGELYDAKSSESIFQGLKALGTDKDEKAKEIIRQVGGYGGLGVQVEGLGFNTADLGRKFHRLHKLPNYKLKDQVMYELLLAKATQNPTLLKALLDTGNSILIEDTANSGFPRPDSYWGNALDKNGKVGANKLGLAWMRVRETLRNEYNAGYIPVRIGLSPELAAALGHKTPSPHILPGPGLSRQHIDSLPGHTLATEVNQSGRKLAVPTHLPSQPKIQAEVKAGAETPAEIQSAADTKRSGETKTHHDVTPGTPVLSARLVQAESDTSSLHSQFDKGDAKSISEGTGLKAAQTHAKIPKTSFAVPGITLEQLSKILKDKESLPHGQKSGIVVRKTAQVGEQTTFEVINIDTKTLTESSAQNAEDKALSDLQSRISALEKSKEEANQKLTEARNDYEVSFKAWQEKKDQYENDKKDHEAKAKSDSDKNSENKAKYERDLSEWERRKKELDAKKAAKKNKIRSDILKAAEKVKAFIQTNAKNEKDRPFLPLQDLVQKLNVAELAAHANTLKEMLIYMKRRVDPDFDPSITGRARSLSETEIYSGDRDYLLGLIERFKEKYQEDLKAAENSLGAKPDFTPIVTAKFDSKAPPEPSKQNLNQGQATVQTIEQQLQDAKKALEAAKALKSTTARDESTVKRMGNIIHQDGAVKITVDDPKDTQKVFETVKGIQGQAKIRNPDYNNPEVATQMAIHSILTLGLVPKFDPPWRQVPGLDGTLSCAPELQHLCEQLKTSIDTQSFPDEASKNQAQRSFDRFMNENGIKLEDMKFNLKSDEPKSSQDSQQKSPAPVVLSSKPKA